MGLKLTKDTAHSNTARLFKNMGYAPFIDVHIASLPKRKIVVPFVFGCTCSTLLHTNSREWYMGQTEMSSNGDDTKLRRVKCTMPGCIGMERVVDQDDNSSCDPRCSLYRGHHEVLGENVHASAR